MTVEQHFAAYQQYHQDKLNKLCHYVFIPWIVYAVLNLFYQIPHLEIAGHSIDWAILFYLSVSLFYFSLDWRLTLGIGLLAFPLYLLARVTDWKIGVGAFLIGWLFQFLGHHHEGKKPAFLTNALHLLIGPLWITSHLMETVGLWTPRRVEVAQ
jgi:uncharacterized membrane protein YGL010W